MWEGQGIGRKGCKDTFHWTFQSDRRFEVPSREHPQAPRTNRYLNRVAGRPVLPAFHILPDFNIHRGRRMSHVTVLLLDAHSEVWFFFPSFLSLSPTVSSVSVSLFQEIDTELTPCTKSHAWFRMKQTEPHPYVQRRDREQANEKRLKTAMMIQNVTKER